MAIKDYILSLPKLKRMRFYQYVKEHADMPYYTVHYKFFRNGGHATTADVLLFERLIEEFELNDSEDE